MFQREEGGGVLGGDRVRCVKNHALPRAQQLHEAGKHNQDPATQRPDVIGGFPLAPSPALIASGSAETPLTNTLHRPVQRSGPRHRLMNTSSSSAQRMERL